MRSDGQGGRSVGVARRRRRSKGSDSGAGRANSETGRKFWLLRFGATKENSNQTSEQRNGTGHR